jgi:hypothetical protein
VTYWLVTSTFYGQWLPGDERGSVTNVRDQRAGVVQSKVRHEHSHPGEAYDCVMPGLHRAAVEQLKGPPVAVNLAQAEALLGQFLETAAYRGWILHAVSIMVNHIHLVVECPTNIGKYQLLRDFKGYGSRRLNHPVRQANLGHMVVGWRVRARDSRSHGRNPLCLLQTTIPLVVWSRERGRIPVTESHPNNKYGA